MRKFFTVVFIISAIICGVSAIIFAILSDVYKYSPENWYYAKGIVSVILTFIFLFIARMIDE